MVSLQERGLRRGRKRRPSARLQAMACKSARRRIQSERPLFKLTPKHISAIRRSRLGAELERGATAAIGNRPWSELNKAEQDELYDACLDALFNEAPVKKTFMAEGSFGDFPICIKGVSGAYFVSAVEHDEAGPFDTLDEANAWISLNFGHMLVTGHDEIE